MFVSQVRENIGVAFGEKYTRSGGKSLDFYGSQALWLAKIKELKRDINKITRPIGVQIKAKCKKNKVSLPFRQCEFPILFGFGVDSFKANIDWLKSADMLHLAGFKDLAEARDFLKESDNLDDEAYEEHTRYIDNVVIKAWADIDESFLPKRRKYK